MQNTIKLYHWMTILHPRHVASDKLYETLSNAFDKFVEVYIGRYSRPKFSKKELSIDIGNINDHTASSYLDECIKYFTDDIYMFVSKEDVDLLNIRDEIVAALNQTKYLFTLR